MPETETLLAQILEQQQAKVLRLARELVPGATEDDLTQPHDFPALVADSVFNYEDGIAAGLQVALTAVRAARARA